MKIAAVIAQMVIFLLIYGCSRVGVEDQSNATISAEKELTVSLALPAGAADTLIQAVAFISAPDMDTIVQLLSIGNGKVFGTVNNIPCGKQRHIEITVYGKSETIAYYGDAWTDVLPGQVMHVWISLKPVKGSIIINGTVQDDSVGSPFKKTDGTVFLADFNENAFNKISNTYGTIDQCVYDKGLFGSALVPSGTGKPICRFTGSSSLSLKQGSMEALVYCDNLSSDYNHIIDKSWQYVLSVYNGNIACYFGGGWWYTNVKFQTSQWNYLCATFDGNKMRLFVNGLRSDSCAYAGNGGDSTYNLGIGNADASTHNVPFRGKIDAIRICNRALSSDEINSTWQGIETVLKKPSVTFCPDSK